MILDVNLWSHRCKFNEGLYNFLFYQAKYLIFVYEQMYYFLGHNTNFYYIYVETNCLKLEFHLDKWVKH